MAYASVNGHPIGTGWLSVPRAGRPVAEVRIAVDAKKKPLAEGDAATLAFQDGTQYAMTCMYAGVERGLMRVKLAGGAGKLDTPVRPKFYRGIAARAVITDVLAEVGEQPGDIDAPGAFEAYVRMAEPARLALGTALHAKWPQHVWRVKADGKLYVLQDTFPDFGQDLDVIEAHPGERRAVCRPVPSLQPGVTTNLGRVDRVRQVFSPEGVNTEVHYV